MSRELSLKVLADPDVQKLTKIWNKQPVFFVTRAVSYTEALVEALDDIDDDDFRVLAEGMVPAAVIFYANKTISPDEVASRIIKDTSETLKLVIEVERVLEEKREAEAKALAEAKAEEEAKLKAEEEAEKQRLLDLEKEREEAKAAQEAARKAEIQKIADQKAANAKAAADKKAAEEAAKKAADEEKADVEIEAGIEDEVPLTAAELRDMPIEDSGLRADWVADFVKARVKTVGMLMDLGEGQGGDFSIVNGIGEKTSEKINERLEILKARVKD